MSKPADAIREYFNTDWWKTLERKANLKTIDSLWEQTKGEVWVEIWGLVMRELAEQDS